METVFIQSVIQGDYNRVTYSLKKERGKRNQTTVKQIFWTGEMNMAVKNELNRGKKFFNQNDGFLFGAIVDLKKMGTFSEVYT